MSESNAPRKGRQDVLDQVIEQIATMDPNLWQKSWLVLGRDVPVAANTNGAYRGGNRFILNLMFMMGGYSKNRWITAGNAEKLGGHIPEEHKGRGVLCEYWGRRQQGRPKADEKEPEDQDGTNTDGTIKRYTRFCSVFVVYNVDLVEGLPEAVREGPEKDLKPLRERMEKVEAMLAAIPADIRHGSDRACYRRIPDHVLMPAREQFTGANDEARLANYYATLLHELAHWTGHESRINRTFGVFGDATYAREELIAEMTSCFLCADLEIPMENLQHPEYLANWFQKVKDEPDVLLRSANAAKYAATFLRDFQWSEIKKARKSTKGTKGRKRTSAKRKSKTRETA